MQRGERTTRTLSRYASPASPASAEVISRYLVIDCATLARFKHASPCVTMRHPCLRSFRLRPSRFGRELLGALRCCSALWLEVGPRCFSGRFGQGVGGGGMNWALLNGFVGFVAFDDCDYPVGWKVAKTLGRIADRPGDG